MAKNNVCSLLFRNELEKEDIFVYKKEKYVNSLFFYYNKKCYNTDNFSSTSAHDFDAMLEIENGYLYIKYMDDDCVSVMKTDR